MKLTDKETETIKQEWGERANEILSLILKKKGKLGIFNEDGSLKVTKEEVEKKLNKQPKLKAMNQEEEDDLLNILWNVKEILPTITSKEVALRISGRLDELKKELDGVVERINQKRLSGLAEEIKSMPEEEKKKLLDMLGM